MCAFWKEDFGFGIGKGGKVFLAVRFLFGACIYYFREGLMDLNVLPIWLWRVLNFVIGWWRSAPRPIWTSTERILARRIPLEVVCTFRQLLLRNAAGRASTNGDLAQWEASEEFRCGRVCNKSPIRFFLFVNRTAKKVDPMRSPTAYRPPQIF